MYNRCFQCDLLIVCSLMCIWQWSVCVLSCCLSLLVCPGESVTSKKSRKRKCDNEKKDWWYRKASCKPLWNWKALYFFQMLSSGGLSWTTDIITLTCCSLGLKCEPCSLGLVQKLTRKDFLIGSEHRQPTKCQVPARQMNNIVQTGGLFACAQSRTQVKSENSRSSL